MVSSSFNLTHWVALESEDGLDANINLSDYDYILFDNFPNSDIHIQYLNKIHNFQIPIIFFQGYDFNVKYLTEILDLYGNTHNINLLECQLMIFVIIVEKPDTYIINVKNQ